MDRKFASQTRKFESRCSASSVTDQRAREAMCCDALPLQSQESRSMKFVEDGQWDEVVRRAPMSIRQAAELIAKVPRTVHYVQEHGIPRFADLLSDLMLAIFVRTN